MGKPDGGAGSGIKRKSKANLRGGLVSEAGWRMIGFAALMFVVLGVLIWLATEEEE